MASIRFNLKPISDKKMQIRAIFQDGQKQKSKYTGETIPANKVKESYKYWDADKQIVRGLEQANRINLLLDKWKTNFAVYVDECKRENKRPDIEYFIQGLKDGNIVTAKPKALREVADLFIKAIASTHNNTTVKGYKVIRGNIAGYEKEKNKTVYLQDIDRAFYKDFCTYLITKENNYNPTLNKNQVKIITMVNYAVNDLKIKLVGNDYEKKYKFKEVPAPKFPLNAGELGTLKSAVLEDKYHQMVIDSFLLACETGLRYSDIVQLKAAHFHIYLSPGGIIKYIDLMNMKGSHENNMPLSIAALSICEKYMVNEGNLFTFHYSQTASRILKRVFKDLKMDRPCEVVQMQGAKTIRVIKPLHELISFHMARNTYITRLLTGNVAPVHVQGNAGHSDIKITMGYFRATDITRWEETLKVLNKN